NLIGNGLCLLLGDPNVRQRCSSTPELIPSTIEECLRFESPNQLGNRLVVERICVRGVTFEPGTYLTLCIGAANRDAEEFPQPEIFDPGRRPNRHLAFAAGGHACAGMSIARLEAQIAIPRLIQRFPDMQLTGRPVRGGRARFRGFSSLPAQVGT
ncbi:MAG: cytochrome P450, partial [Sinobacteraceae bacterium]|nr:cytochrome P450 [Nevskiaceae bacterium]